MLLSGKRKNKKDRSLLLQVVSLCFGHLNRRWALAQNAVKRVTGTPMTALFRPLAALVLASLLTLSSHAETRWNQSYGPDPEQRYDVTLAARGDPAPVILMVHGGGWSFGDKSIGRVVSAKIERWVPRGFAVASTNYRMQPKATPLEQARDVARALADLQQRAGRLGIDPEAVVLMGHSAGAHLIALLAARPELIAGAGAKPPAGYVLLDSGALDVPAIMRAPHFRLYDRAFGSNPADWADASPYQQLNQAPRPILAVCSSLRRISCQQAETFIAKVRRLGGTGEVLPKALSHGEVNAQVGVDAEYTAEVEHFMARLGPRIASLLR